MQDVAEARKCQGPVDWTRYENEAQQTSNPKSVLILSVLGGGGVKNDCEVKSQELYALGFMHSVLTLKRKNCRAYRVALNISISNY